MLEYRRDARINNTIRIACDIERQRLMTGQAPNMFLWTCCCQEASFLLDDMEKQKQQQEEKKIDLRASSTTVEIDLTQEMKGEHLEFICTNCGEQGNDTFHYAIHTNGRCEDPNVSCYACKRVMCKRCRLNGFDEGGTLMLFPMMGKNQIESGDGDWEIHMCRWCVNNAANRLKRKKEHKRLVKKDGKVTAKIDRVMNENKKFKGEKEL